MRLKKNFTAANVIAMLIASCVLGTVAGNFTASNSSPDDICGELAYAMVYYNIGNGIPLSEIMDCPAVEIVEDYKTCALVKTTEHTISQLRQKGAVVQTLPNIGVIKYETITFRTADGEPQIPPEYTAQEAAPAQKNEDEHSYYIIQVKGPPKPIWIEAIQQCGVEIIEVHNYYAYLVHATQGEMRNTEKLPFVTWTGIYQPYYKIRQGVEHEDGTLELRVTLFSTAMLSETVSELEKYCCIKEFYVGVSGWDHYADIVTDSSMLPHIAGLRDVKYIEHTPKPVLFSRGVGGGILNDNARWIIQSGVSGSTPVWNNGIHGEGMIVGIADTGCDYDHKAFTNAPGDKGTPGPSHRKIVNYHAIVDDWDDGSVGHGTHTGGSIAGNNIDNPNSYSTNDGMAYMAKLSVEDCSSGSGISAGPIQTLLQKTYDDGARIHSDSWGDLFSTYGSMAEGFDRYTWEHPNFVSVVAAGNAGPSSGSVGNPAVAKNVITVGACYNGASENLASFSSRGPTDDGVMKPDIVAPGVDVYSAKSDGIRDSYNGGYQPMQGTSMSTPIVAGGTALIRQYFMEGFYPSGKKNTAHGFEPSAALIKAVVINSGSDLSGVSTRIPSNEQGWGRLTLDKTLFFEGDARKLWIHDAYNGSTGLMTGDKYTSTITVETGEELRITLVWSDYHGAGLKNDLNLVVTGPGGKTYIGNNFAGGQTNEGSASPDGKNPVECVYIKSPTAGAYKIEVIGGSVTSGAAQKFALAVSGKLSLYGITLSKPTGGESLIGGSAYNIQWNGNGGNDPVSVEIFFSDNGGTTYNSTATGQPQSGTFAWSVPMINTNKARIRVVSTDAESRQASAESADFTIKVPHTVQLTSPNGGELLTGGSTFSIKWTTSGGTGLTISLFLSTDGGASYPTTIASGIADSGSYTWTVPSIDASNARLKASATNSLSETVEDASDADFSIDSTAPFLTILSPSAGTVWREGVQSINWSVTEAVGLKKNSLNISYSTDDGGNWSVITSLGDSSFTTYSWTVPAATNTENARMRISVFDNIGRTGMSISGRFTIDTEKPVVTHTPVRNGVTGTAVTISAQVTDSVGLKSVVLYYMSVGGSSFTPLTMTGGSAGSPYIATIPPQSAGGTLKYHIVAIDVANHVTLSPSSPQTPSNDLNYTVNIKDQSQTGAISGKVTSIDGLPLAGAVVTAFISGSGMVANTATAAENGIYKIYGLEGGKYDLRANATGYKDGTITAVNVINGQDSGNNDFTLVPWQAAGLRIISGLVKDGDSGSVISGAIVSIVAAGGGVPTPNIKYTLDNGTFYFFNLQPGLYNISISKNGYEDISQQVDVSAKNQFGLVFVLSKQGSTVPPEQENYGLPIPLLWIIAIIAAIVFGLTFAAMLAGRRSRKKKKDHTEFTLPYPQQSQSLQAYMASSEFYHAPEAPAAVPPGYSARSQQSATAPPYQTKTQQNQPTQYSTYSPGSPAPPPMPQGGQAVTPQNVKVCRVCGATNERWKVTCSKCKRPLG